MTPLAIALGTLISEDLMCITAGLLIREQRLGMFAGIVACTLGIYVGDLGLWLLGRILGRGILRWGFIQRRLPEQRIAHFAHWFEQRGLSIVLASRFMPGTRLPMYVAAGVGRVRLWRFAAWTLLAVSLWTPLLVLSVAMIGERIVRPLQWFFGTGWIALAVAAGVLLLIVRLAVLASTSTGRSRLVAKVSTIRHWEFWPTWLFYIPLLPYIAWLSVRHRGMNRISAANPGIEHSGIVGESKIEILSNLPAEWVVRSRLIEADDIANRMHRLTEFMSEHSLDFPLILKPDVGERGAGVKLVRHLDHARAYLLRNSYPILAQQFHPGPYEAGVFYYRYPGESQGQILSITDKVFPRVCGDGQSSVEELILGHPRYRFQADRFLARLNGQATMILPMNEGFQLAIAGNHCQGTMFRDGVRLITPALERRIDEIALQFPGFFFGRFDIRYSDVDAFKQGREFAIVELNGATSESTNIYDPDWSLRDAHRVLRRQWEILFEIGSRNIRRGAVVTPHWDLAKSILLHYRDRQTNPLAD